MIINRYDLTTLVFVDQFSLGTPEAYGEYNPELDECFGISIDETSSKVFAVNNTQSDIVRMDRTSLLGDLLVGSLGSGNDNFSNPTYSTIVEYVPPPVISIPKSFGNIIW